VYEGKLRGSTHVNNTSINTYFQELEQFCDL
jgi:hypothetical protein